MELAAEVFNFGLAGRVVDHGATFGQDGGHQEIVGGRMARVLQREAGPTEAALGRRVNSSRRVGEGCPHGGEAVGVKVDGASAKVVTARERHLDLPAAGQQGAHYNQRCPHRLEEVFGCRRPE